MNRLIKKLLPLALILTLIFVVTACTEDANDEPEVSPPVEETPEATPEPPEDEAEIEPVPPIGEIPDYSAENEEDDDAQQEENTYPANEETPGSESIVYVNGRVVSEATIASESEDGSVITHISLMPLDSLLSMDVFWNMQTNELSLMGRNGFVAFNIGSNDFVVDGSTVTLDYETIRIDDEIYVPIAFFEEVYGATSVTVDDGGVHIETN